MSAKRTAIQELQERILSLEGTLQEAQARIASLHVMQEIAQSLMTERYLEPLLEKVVISAMEVMGASSGALILLDTANDELVFQVAEGPEGELLVGQRMPRNQGIAGWVITHQEPIIVDDLQQDDRNYRVIADTFSYHVTSVICVPMLARNKLSGAIQLLHSDSGRYFSKFDQLLLTIFASQAAIAIENARLHEELLTERDNLIVVEDEIRKRLARDLHDGPTQLVSSVLMSLDFLKQAYQKQPDLIPAELDYTVKTANRALKQLRTLLFDLRPVILETQGLIPALEVYAHRLNELEPFDVGLTLTQDLPRLQYKAEISVFAVIQEAVTNAKKYAQAHQLDLIIEMDSSTDKISVIVKDDGVGFDVEAMQSRYEERGSLGMLNSYERAQSINGTFAIHSEIGKGTTVTLTLPLSENLLETTKDG